MRRWLDGGFGLAQQHAPIVWRVAALVHRSEHPIGSAAAFVVKGDPLLAPEQLSLSAESQSRNGLIAVLQQCAAVGADPFDFVENLAIRLLQLDFDRVWLDGLGGAAPDAAGC